MYTHLPHRGIVCIEGHDRLTFLQGMLTQDMQKLETKPAVYTLRLNRMGRILGDAWVILKNNETWWIDTENPEALAKEWTAKKLRYKVSITHLTDQHVFACWGEELDRVASLAKTNGGMLIEDARNPNMGWRLYGKLPKDTTNLREYRLHTLSLGVPDGSLDFEVERAMPLPWGMESAIGWDKGCYVGQEPVARSRYQGVVRQHIVPIQICQEATYTVDQVSDIHDALGIKQGRLVSRFENRGLALVSTDITDKPLNVRLIAT